MSELAVKILAAKDAKITALEAQNKVLLDLLIDSGEFLDGTWRKRRDAAIAQAKAKS